MRTLIASGIVLASVAVASADDALDRAQIQAGIQPVKAKVMACGDGAKIGGTIKIRATVDAAGKVTAAEASGDDADLGACVAGVIKTAVFARTKTGASFSYPFVFDKAGSDSSAVRSKKRADDKLGKKPGPMPPDDPFGVAPPPANDLERAAITVGVAKAKAKITACGTKYKANAKVKVTVKVAPDGKVTSATTDAVDTTLGTCIAVAIKAVNFGKSTRGGSFTYPFVFGTPAAAPPPTNPGDPELDRATITAGVASARAKVTACGDKHKGDAKLKVTVKVAPDGKVTSATHDASNVALGDCVAAAIKAVTFNKTASGGSFSYPFVFGSPSSSAPASGPVPPPSGTPPLPDEAIDRAAISEGIAKVKAKISACGKGVTAKGTVKINTVVGPDGSVTSATVDKTPDEGLGKCVAAVILSAKFKATAKGGSFTYPFVF